MKAIMKKEFLTENMNNYIGFEYVKAEPMTLGEYNNFKGWPIPNNEDPFEDGYIIHYSKNYVSWEPKKSFESSHMLIVDNNTITQKNVDEFISKVAVQQLGGKTTVVQVTLVNGFVITESSSCVDPKNFSMELGEAICLEKIKNKIWELLGFLLQTAVGGLVVLK